MGDGFCDFSVLLVHVLVAGRRGLGSGRAEAPERGTALDLGLFLGFVLLLLTLLMALAGLAGLAGLVVPVAA